MNRRHRIYFVRNRTTCRSVNQICLIQPKFRCLCSTRLYWMVASVNPRKSIYNLFHLVHLVRLTRKTFLGQRLTWNDPAKMRLASRHEVRKTRSLICLGMCVIGPDNIITHISMKTIMNLFRVNFITFDRVFLFALLRRCRWGQTFLIDIENCVQTYSWITIDRLSKNQNHPHSEFITRNANQTDTWKHLKMAIHSGICNAFGAMMHNLSK